MILKKAHYLEATWLPPMATSAAAKQALSSGDWRETKDPQGKVYFFNRKLNRTTWDLDKELGATPGNTVAQPTPSSSSSSPRPAAAAPTNFDSMAKELVASGVWNVKTASVGGSSFFQHSETGETTRDLALYLEITSAVQADAPVGRSGGRSAADAASPAQQGELRAKSGALLDRNELIGDVDPWVTLFLARDRGGEYEIASRKLLQQILERTGQWDAWSRAEQRAEQLQHELNATKAELVQKEDRISLQHRELEDLRHMLYYGVQGVQMAHRTVKDLPRVPMPAAPREFNAVPNAAATNERVKELEAVVASLQLKNRALAQELEAAQRGTHIAATCGPCAQLDPWRRLVEGTVGQATQQAGGATSGGLVEYPRSTGAPTSLLFLGGDQRRDLHGVGVLPHSLRSPTTRKPAVTTSSAVVNSATTQSLGHASIPHSHSPLRISPASIPNAVLPLSSAFHVRR